jgi:hypothetical protein
MRRRRMLSVVFAVWMVVPTVALGAVDQPPEVSALGDPVVHVTPDRVAEIAFVLGSCSDASACLSQMALYARGGRRLSEAASVSLLPSAGGRFPGLRLTAGAWRALARTKRLRTSLMVRLAGGGRQLLGYETLLAPASGQARWCSGAVRRLAPPCTGPFR